MPFTETSDLLYFLKFADKSKTCLQSLIVGNGMVEVNIQQTDLIQGQINMNEKQARTDLSHDITNAWRIFYFPHGDLTPHS